MQGSKALIGRDRICEYLKIDKNVFYQLIKEGLPAQKLGGRWVSHQDVIDEYFRSRVMTTPPPAGDAPG